MTADGRELAAWAAGLDEAELSARIHATDARGVFALTGGGSGLASALLTVPGASATVLEVVVPYVADALRDLLGSAPEQACSNETARAMAMRAFVRARQLGGDFGFGLTASLATTREHRGEHRFHIAYQDMDVTRSWSVVLNKQGAERTQEEMIACRSALAALAFALGIGDEPNLPGRQTRALDAWRDLLMGRRAVVGAHYGAILPGAFNPLHDGHRALREVAARRLGCDVVYELCIANVDKPPLDYEEIDKRSAQFEADALLLTNAPTFIEKARALGPVTFAVGTDTIKRVAKPHYYAPASGEDATDGETAMHEAFAELDAIGCRFLVFGRKGDDGFVNLDDLDLPEALRTLCDGVPESEFRSDLSSTQIRTEARSR